MDVKDYLSEAIGLGDPAPKDVDGELILPLYVDFRYSDLDPFLKPLRQ